MICKGCKKRYAGCHSECAEYLAEKIMEQPEKEEYEKQKQKAVAISGDYRYRMRAANHHKMMKNTPLKSSKRGQ